MANFIFWSDLHTEVKSFTFPNLSDFDTPPDALLLAGDTSTMLRHLDFALLAHEVYGCPVVMVDGNHEFYGGNIEMIETEEDIRIQEFQKAGAPINILRGGSVEIAGTRIAGATLWTDFDIWPDLAIAGRSAAARGMNDYFQIRTGPENVPFTVHDSTVRHRTEKARLIETLRKPHDGPTVVMTHHLPIPGVIHPKYWRDPLTTAFASDLRKDIANLDFDYWISGHTHDSPELSEDGPDRPRHFVSNQRGYPGEMTHFDPLRMIST